MDHGSTNKLNIVFVGKNYGRYEDFARDNLFINHLSSARRLFSVVEPFQSNSGKINMYATRLKEGETKADAMARCGTNGMDQYIFLDAVSTMDDSYAKICGREAFVYTVTASGDIERIVMHEFGHSFGCLWDEYVYDDEPRSWYQFGWKTALYWAGYKKQQLKFNETNCCTEANSSLCKAYFSKWVNNSPSYAGCTAPGWFKSSKLSIMQDPWNVNKFNEVSKKILQERLDQYEG